MRKPIKIEDFSFSDGLIRGLEVAGDEVKLVFEDSSENLK